MKYRHKYLTAFGPADGPQLPNVFHRYGTKEIDGKLYIGLIQDGQKAPEPTWFHEATLNEQFEPIE